MIESTTPKDNTLNKEKNETEEIMEPSVNLKLKHKTESENNKKTVDIKSIKADTDDNNEILDTMIKEEIVGNDVDL